MMDNETRTILQKSVNDWCNKNTDIILDLEHHLSKESFPAVLYDELNDLGLLSILHDPDTLQDLSMVAEVAFQFAKYSASIALMVVQQNIASSILAHAALDAPKGWVALPFYDSLDEWPYLLNVKQLKTNTIVTGSWQSISLLPIADSLLLPVIDKQKKTFTLALINMRDDHPKGFEVSSSIISLGLRGAPSSDLLLNDYKITKDAAILTGIDAQQCVNQIWSQAEIFIMAIRSGIFESSYVTAKNYATERWQGGKIIIEHSLIRKMLADLYREKCAMEENWRSLSQTIDPNKALSCGQLGIALASAEKLPWFASDGIQLLGGIGYMEDFSQERRFRDAKQCEFLLGHPQAKAFSNWQAEVG